MPERPAPHHSAALNRMVNLPPLYPDLEPPLPPIPTHQLAEERRKAHRRRTAAARSRARKTAA